MFAKNGELIETRVRGVEENRRLSKPSVMRYNTFKITTSLFVVMNKHHLSIRQ